MLKNMKIGKKLIISFIIIAILASVSGITSIFILKNVDRQYSDALDRYGFCQDDIGHAMLMASEINRYIRDVANSTDQSSISTAKNQIEQNWNQYEQYAAIVKSTLITDITNNELTSIFDNIEKAQAAFETTANEVINLGNTADQTQNRLAQKKAVSELDPLYDQLYSAWNDLLTSSENIGSALSEQLSSQSALCTVITIVLCVIAFVISIIFGSSTARSIARPITICANRLGLLVKGDLTTPVPAAASKDETGLLLNALDATIKDLSAVVKDMSRLLNSMADGNFDVHTEVEENYVGEFQSILKAIRTMNIELSHTLASIDQSANQVNSGADQVSSGAQALAQGATEQASSVQELAATVNDISNQVSEASENAQVAKAKAVETADRIVSCNQHMQDMTAAMNEINDSSNEIGKIIATIENIAFQTNILALNAAVEAARAGTAGKGFAVVADEVRSLANKSQEASQDTATLIERAMTAVKSGMSIAHETAESLLVFVDDIKATAQTVEDIAKASEVQASAISQVSQGIDQISSVVQTNAATAEESAAASEELTGQAQMLKQMVSKFTLRSTDSTVPTLSYTPMEMPSDDIPPISEPAVKKPSRPVVKSKSPKTEQRIEAEPPTPKKKSESKPPMPKKTIEAEPPMPAMDDLPDLPDDYVSEPLYFDNSKY